VTATQIIEEIKRLDSKEQLGVIRFAYQLEADGKRIVCSGGRHGQYDQSD